MIPLKGRLIAELIDNSYTRGSGLIILDRKNVASRAKVLAIGAISQDRSGNSLFCPAKIGDIIHFKKYKPMVHSSDPEGLKAGKVTMWFEDIVGVES